MKRSLRPSAKIVSRVTGKGGVVLACYFMGLLAGSMLCHRLIQRVGHIRAFTVFAAVTTAAALLHSLCITAWFWSLLRFASGISAFGLFVVIESWSNECTEPHFRGRVFSIYMTLSYLGVGIGHQRRPSPADRNQTIPFHGDFSQSPPGNARQHGRFFWMDICYHRNYSRTGE